MDTLFSESEIPNPLLCNAPNSICIICNKKLENISTVSVQEILPHYKPTISFFEGLKLLTNFGDCNIDNVPQRACNTCYLNTDGFLRFQNACSKAADNISGYILNQERILQHIEEEFNASSSSDDNSNSTFTKEDHPIQLDTIDWNEEEIIKKVESKKIIKPKVECTECHKLISRYHIKTHMDIHAGNKPYQCKICARKFTGRSSLYLHIKIHHSDVYPHLCPMCGKKFKTANQLNVHMRVGHTDERPYPCETCGKAFKRISMLKEHCVIHTGEKNFQCEKCPKKFSSQKLLKQHSVTHAAVRPIECTFCGKRFTQHHCLRSHQAKTCEALHAEAYNSNPN